MTNQDLQTLTDLIEKYGPNNFLQGCVTAFEKRGEEVFNSSRSFGARQCYLNTAEVLREASERAPDSSYIRDGGEDAA